MFLGVAAGGEFLDRDESWAPLAEALAGEGIEALVAAWEDPGVDWGRYDLVTVTYAWGYVTWSGGVSTRGCPVLVPGEDSRRGVPSAGQRRESGQ